MNLIVGGDFGRMYTKLYTVIDGQEIKLKGPNAICIGYDRRIDQETLNKEMDYELEDLLDVTVTKDGDSERYFVGEFARKNHRNDILTSSNQINKFCEFTADKERGKLFAYVALAAYKSNKNELRVRPSLGAPTEEFYDKNGKVELSEFKNNTVEMTVKLNHPKFQGFEVNIIPTEMDFSPEGTASSYSARYKINLSTMGIEECEWMSEQLKKGGIVYISNLGSSTEDCAGVTSKGFDTRCSFGIEVGSSVATSSLQADLEREHNFKKDKTTIDYYLQLTAPKESNIRYMGEEIDINKMSKPYYRSMIERRNQLTFDKLNRKGLDPGDIVAQYQTGGTVDYLKLIKMDKSLKLFKHAEIKISDDPHFDEAKGYYIISMLKQEYEKKNAAQKFGLKDTGTTSDKDTIDVE